MLTTLSQLTPGDSAKVIKVRGGGSIQRRIIDMGVVTGTVIEMLKFAPLGDPVEVRVKGFNLTLRKAEAEFIEIECSEKR